MWKATEETYQTGKWVTAILTEGGTYLEVHVDGIDCPVPTFVFAFSGNLTKRCAETVAQATAAWLDTISGESKK